MLWNDLQVAEERLRTMVESAHDYAIINLDLAGRVTYWNAGAERLLGYSEQSILEKPGDVVFSDEERRPACRPGNWKPPWRTDEPRAKAGECAGTGPASGPAAW